MILIDTNVVIYAVGRSHYYRESCTNILEVVARGSQDYTIDTELLQEVLHVFNRRGQRDFGLAYCDRLLTLFPDPIAITRDEISLARQLMAMYSHLAARDAIHAAVVQVHRLEGIVSADRVYDGVKELRRFDPLEM
jgi:predicted nucleic acid-binding protein